MKSRAKELKNKAKAKISAIFAPEAALNTIKLSLGLLEKVVDGVPVPGLKAVVGSVLLVMQKIEVCAGSARIVSILSDAR